MLRSLSASRSRRGDFDAAIPALWQIAILLLAALVTMAWLVLAIGHLHDRFNVNTVSGALLALADRASEGVLYPPLFDGHAYAGTRTMPLPILAYALATSWAGDVLAPAKLVDFISSVALVTLVAGILVRQGAGWLLSLGLVTTVISSQVFLLVATGIRPESAPTALQLGAVALVAFVPRRRAVAMAAILCAVAIFFKLSAIWAPLAIALVLLFNNRRQLVLFSAVFIGVAGLLLGVFVVASEGRMLTNLVELGGAGLSVSGLVKAPLKTIDLVVRYAQASLVLLPLVILGLFFASRQSRPTIFQVALACAVAVLLTVMADIGSDYNHLLDVIVILAIVAHESVDGVARRVADARPVWMTLAAALLVGSSAALAVNAGWSVAAIIRLPGSSISSEYDPEPLAHELAGLRSVLSEDPYVPLARGDRPIVADPFMLLRIATHDSELVAPLEGMVAARQFDAIVLTEDLAHPASAAWFEDFAFGSSFHDLIRRNYRLCLIRDGYYLYVPPAVSCPSGSP